MQSQNRRTEEQKEGDQEKTALHEGEEFVVEGVRRGQNFAWILGAYNSNFPQFPIDGPKLATTLRKLWTTGHPLHERLKSNFVEAADEGCVWVFGRSGGKGAGYCNEKRTRHPRYCDFHAARSTLVRQPDIMRDIPESDARRIHDQKVGQGAAASFLDWTWR